MLSSRDPGYFVFPTHSSTSRGLGRIDTTVAGAAVAPKDILASSLSSSTSSSLSSSTSSSSTSREDMSKMSSDDYDSSFLHHSRSQSEVQRELGLAIAEQLSPPIVLAKEEVGPRRAHSRPQLSDGGLLSQFRTGTGWFAPVVPPPRKLTAEEREVLEAQRIKKLRETGKGSRRRPGLVRSPSSGGVEMLGFGSSSSTFGGN